MIPSYVIKDEKGMVYSSNDAGLKAAVVSYLGHIGAESCKWAGIKYFKHNVSHVEDRELSIWAENATVDARRDIILILHNRRQTSVFSLELGDEFQLTPNGEVMTVCRKFEMHEEVPSPHVPPGFCLVRIGNVIRFVEKNQHVYKIPKDSSVTKENL